MVDCCSAWVSAGWTLNSGRSASSAVDRGRDSDARARSFSTTCFAHDVVEANGQPFLFLPRPAKPPVLVGGRAPHALERAARFGDGWLPMGMKPAEMVGREAEYRRI